MTLLVRHLAWACLAVLLASPVSAQQTDPYAEALKYTFDRPRAVLLAIEAQIRAAKPAEMPAIEAKLLAILQSPQAAKDAKDWACRQLRQAGSERSAAALAALLADKDLATVARIALEGLPGPKVDAALREALGKVQGDLKAGVAQTIGARSDRQAVPLLAPLASDANAPVAEAALYALGHIGGAEALTALQNAKPPEGLKKYRFHAILLCAERLAGEGKPAEAAAVYREVYGQATDVAIKGGALRGMVATEKAKAVPLVLAALRGGNRRLRGQAAKYVAESGESELMAAVLAEFSALKPDVQAMILDLVDDKAALAAVLGAAKSANEAVRLAALGALGRIGDSSAVPVLLGIAVAEKGESQAAARKALEELRGEGAGAALTSAAAERGPPAARVEAIRVLAARNSKAATAIVLKAVDDADKSVQAAALLALGSLADQKHLPALVKLLAALPAERRGAAEEAVAAACRRAGDKDAAAGTVLAALPGAAVDLRCALLRVAARTGAAKALEALRAAVKDAEAPVKDTAIRGLAEWPTGEAVPDLLAIARSGDGQVHKVLALRGVIRLASLPRARPAGQTAKLLGEALKLAARTEEKRMVLAALAEVHHPAALPLAIGCLDDKDLEVEAATATVRIAKALRVTNMEAAAAAVRKVLEECKSPEARQIAESAMMVLGDLVNIAPEGTATSPDGWEKDGTSHGDQAAIDGDPDTYWDEEDGKPLYRLVVTFKQPQPIVAVSVQGYGQHNFAPRDFEILCDGKPVKKVTNAQYDSNLLLVRLSEVTSTTVELKITGYYGGSPAVRELGIYRAAGAKPRK